MTYDPTGKRVLITGASSGIGAAMARGLAERGAVVGICARREDRLREVLADCLEHSPQSRMWVIDLADLDAVTAFTHRAIDELGGLDLLINNAGIPKRRTVRAMRPDEVDSLMQINYLSPVRIMLAALPTLLERGHQTGEPTHIVNISSVAARLSPPGEAPTPRPKRPSQRSPSRMAAELWAEPVRVHLINPGVVDTDLFDPDMPDNDLFIADDVDRLDPSVGARRGTSCARRRRGRDVGARVVRRCGQGEGRRPQRLPRRCVVLLARQAGQPRNLTPTSW